METLPTLQRRSAFTRTNVPGALRINRPDGFPSGYSPAPDPVYWVGVDSPNFFAQNHTAALGAVTRAVSLIANTIAATPWRVLTGGPSPSTSTIEMPSPRWLIDPSLLRPDNRYLGSPQSAALQSSRSMFWASWIRSVLLKGMGYLIFQEDATGAPLAGTMKVLNPDFVSPQWSQDLGTYRRIGSDKPGATYVDTDSTGHFTLGPITYRMVEMPNPLATPDEYGITPSVLGMHAREIGLANQAVDYAKGAFKSGVPYGYLKVSKSIDADQANLYRDQWMQSHGGDLRSIAVLGASVDFVPIQMSPMDLALIEQRRMSLVDIGNIFGVPVFLLNGSSGDSNSYSNTESRSIDLKQWTLFPWATLVEEILSSFLPQNNWVIVDFRGLLRSDTKTRYESYAIALQSGWMTQDEVRKLESLPSLVGGDSSSEVPTNETL